MLLAIQLNLFMVILLSIIAVHAYCKLDKKNQIHRLFFALILLTLLILLLEILSVVLNSGFPANCIIAHKLVDTAGFALTPLIPITVALYVLKRTNNYTKISRPMVFWSGIPLVINSILSIGSYNFHWIFSITNENMYARGPLFFVSPLTSYFYYVINMLLLYTNRRKLPKEELIILSLLTIIPALLSSFQLYYFIYLTIWNSVAIAVVINYIFLVHSQTKLDPLTGLGNRLAYTEYLAAVRKKSNLILSVINIDLDDFKSINDKFGHHEGDQVLILFAGYLENVFAGNGLAIRVGGDEFIIFLHDNKKEIIEKYINDLTARVSAYNENNSLPYRVKFSYGLTIYNNNDYTNVYELIQHSDKLMYEEKKKKNCKAT